jgi:hypothetical protein
MLPLHPQNVAAQMDVLPNWMRKGTSGMQVNRLGLRHRQLFRACTSDCQSLVLIRDSVMGTQAITVQPRDPACCRIEVGGRFTDPWSKL